MELKQRIREWFGRAEKLIDLYRNLADSGCQHVRTFATNVHEHSTPAEIHEAIGTVEAEEREIVNELRDGADSIMSELSWLAQQIQSEDIWEAFESIYPDLGDFVSGPYPGGRFSVSAIESWGWDIRRWAREAAFVREGLIARGNSVERLQRFDEKSSDCPWSESIANDVRRRLFAERTSIERMLKPDGRKRQETSMDCAESATAADQCTIPLEFRSKRMSKIDALIYAKPPLHMNDRQQMDWFNKSIESGDYSCFAINRKAFYWDIRTFPEEARDEMKQL